LNCQGLKRRRGTQTFVWAVTFVNGTKKKGTLVLLADLYDLPESIRSLINFQRVPVGGKGGKPCGRRFRMILAGQRREKQSPRSECWWEFQKNAMQKS